MDIENRLPWERQHAESEPAYKAFGLYRDMAPGHRAVDKVADILKPMPGGPSEGQRRAWRRLSAWTQQWRWTERVAAYDAEQDRIARAQFEQARFDARASRLSVYDKIILSGERVMDRFQRVVESEQLDKLDLARAKVKGKAPDGSWIESERRAITDLVGPMVPAIVEAGRGQRLDYGEPTDRMEQTGTLRYEHEHKDVDDFRSDLENLDAQLDALGVSDDVGHELAAAIRRHDAAAEAESQREEQSC